jgi:hypothetical protein
MVNSNSSDISISIPGGIKEMLEEKLIQSNVGIEKVYSWIFDYFNHQFYGSDEPKDFPIFVNELTAGFSEIKLKQIRTVGIDLPILLSKGKNRPVLMICAMDPLRDETDGETPSNDIGLWVPFSAINNPRKKGSNMKPSDKRNLSFFHTLLETHDLYLTDAYKLFYREGKKKSNGQNKFKSLEVHSEILEKEIRLVKPSAIITLGNAARNAICGILKLEVPTWSDTVYKTKTIEDVNVVMVPHISGSANGYKAPILKNEKYKNVEGDNNPKYARIIQSVIQ